MKKILTHLTGIVCITTILVACGCAQDPGTNTIENMEKVEISCKAIIANGVLRFEMYDSNTDSIVVAKPSKDDPAKLVADLVTVVKPKTKVIWTWANGSEIEKFVKIGPQTPGPIMPGNAKKVLFSNRLKLKVHKQVKKGEESYVIEFKDLNEKLYKVDPYLKIR